MELQSGFSVPAPPDTTYRFLLDLERVAPCIPGGELGAPTADGVYPAKVTVKLGPMRLGYEGTIEVSAADDAARTATLSATARESRGSGTARATIAMRVWPDDMGASVAVTTDLELTGRAAQMGRGVVEDVARKLVDEMAACLAVRIAAAEQPAANGGATPTAAAPKPVSALALLRGVLRTRIAALLHREGGR